LLLFIFFVVVVVVVVVVDMPAAKHPLQHSCLVLVALLRCLVQWVQSFKKYLNWIARQKKIKKRIKKRQKKEKKQETTNSRLMCKMRLTDVSRNKSP
jgi:heme exporter protein D